VGTYRFSHPIYSIVGSKIDGVWTALGVIFTGATFLVAWFQLNSISKTSKSDFIHKFKKDFFTPKTRRVFSLVDTDKVKFVNKGKDSYFKNSKTNKKEFDTYELDDLLLGHLEDLGAFEKNGVLDIGMVYELFYYYLENTWKNKEIQKYISPEFQGEGDAYDNFRYLYKKATDYSRAKENHDLLFWKLKWKISSLL
jgi:hypothetical protein